MTMDYTYIEQLLEKYFECETSLGEEKILQAFFMQENVPVRLLPYRNIFTEPLQAKQEETLSDSFDERLIALMGQQEENQPVRVKAKVISMQQRLQPLYKAVACVAVVLALGQAAQMPYREAERQQENIASTIQKPEVMQNQNAVAQSDTVKKAAEMEAVRN